jgi:hypothetical protein
MTGSRNSALRDKITALVCFCLALAVGADLIDAQANAQDMRAMRAPLSIIPPAAQADLTAGAGARNSRTAKLAPNAAARQMKRAVRAVASVPGTQTDIVQIGQLGALEDAPIGLEDGFGRSVWAGARLAYVSDLLSRLPETHHLAALREMETTLLRGAASAPAGSVQGTSWTAARLNRLLTLGETRDVIDLANLTGAAANDAYALRILVQAYLARDERDAACTFDTPQKGMVGQRDTKLFFLKLLIFCQLNGGEYDKAALALDLNEKTLADAGFFRDLAFLVAAQAPLEGDDTQLPPLPVELDVLDVALLRLAQLTPPTNPASLPPAFWPVLGNDYTMPPALQLAAAQVSVQRGHLPADSFSQIGQLADLETFRQLPLPQPKSALPEAVRMAMTLRLVDAAPVDAQGRLMAVLLKQAARQNNWATQVRVLNDRLVDLSANRAVPAINSGADESMGSANQAAMDAPATDDVFADSFALSPARNDDPILLPALLLLEAPATEFADWPMPELMTRLLDEATGNIPLSEGEPLAALFADDAMPVFDAPDKDSNSVALENNPDIVNQDAAGEDMVSAFPAAGLRAAPVNDWESYISAFQATKGALRAYLAHELAVWQGQGVALPPVVTAMLGFDEQTPQQARLMKLAENGWVGDLVLALVADFGARPVAGMAPGDVAAMLTALRQAGLNAQGEKLAREILLHSAATLMASDAFTEAVAAADPAIIGGMVFDDTGFDDMAEDAQLPAADADGVFAPVPPGNGR